MRTFLKTAVLLVGLVIITASCGKLAGGGSLIGVWAVTDYEIIYNGVSQPKTEETDEDVRAYKTTIEFYEDGKTGKIGYGVFTYTLKDDTIYFNDGPREGLTMKIVGKRLISQGWIYFPRPPLYMADDTQEVRLIFEKVSN